MIPDWPKRWGLASQTKSRAHAGLMSHIQTDPSQFRVHWDVLEDKDLAEDVLTWGPEGVWRHGKFYTANSVRLARHLDLMHRKMPTKGLSWRLDGHEYPGERLWRVELTNKRGKTSVCQLYRTAPTVVAPAVNT